MTSLPNLPAPTLTLNRCTSTVLKFTLQATQRLANANLARGASVAVGVGMIAKNEYRIEPIGAEFRVIDCEGVQVGSFLTEEGARQDMERGEKEKACWIPPNCWWTSRSRPTY